MISIDRRIFSHFNWGLFGITLLLFFIGVVNLYSASSLKVEHGVKFIPYYKKQLIWGMGGIIAFFLAMVIDYRRFKEISTPLYVLSLILVALVPFIGKTIGGAKRWLDLGCFSFQPTELVKLSVIIWVATYLSNLSSPIGWKDLGKILLTVLVPVGFIIKQPDLGSGLNILMVVGGMMLFYGIKKRILIVGLIMIPLLCPIAWHFMHDYQKKRIKVLFNPEKYRLKEGYNIIQSKIAIGSGKVWGKGFLEGTQSQLKFLPEKHTDFVFAVFAEEWGFMGCLILLCLCAFFLYQITKVVELSKDNFGAYLCVGIFFYFFWQFFINISMVLGILPVVGIPLPFLSYGGSSTIVNFSLIGLVSNVSMRRFIFKNGFS